MKNNLDKFKKKYKSALVTGGAGFIGSHICEELVNAGIETYSVDNYIAGKRKNIRHLENKSNFHEIICDIRDKDELGKHMQGIDIVFHEAASKKSVSMINPRKDLEINAAGTLNLLELASKFNIKKFVHASTGSVYGEPLYVPQDEEHPLNPVSHYGVSKLAGEKYVAFFHKQAKLDTTVLRYFHIYGPRQEFNEFGGVVAIFVRNILNNQQPIIFGSGEQERSFTFVKDVVNANILVAISSESKGEVYNCASGLKITINQLLRLVLQYFGLEGKVKPIYKQWLPGDIKKFDISNNKLSKLGISFSTDFETRLKETIVELESYISEGKKK